MDVVEPSHFEKGPQESSGLRRVLRHQVEQILRLDSEEVEGELAQQGGGEDRLDRIQLLLDLEGHEGIEGYLESPGELEKLAGLRIFLSLLDLGEIGDRQTRPGGDRLQGLSPLLAEAPQLQPQDVAELLAVDRGGRGRFGGTRSFADREIIPCRSQRIFA